MRTRLPTFALPSLLVSALLAACGGGGDPTVEAVDAQSARVKAMLPACPVAPSTLTDIVTVQGAGPSSPLEGQRVTVRGVVTADLRGSGEIGGLFIQQPVPDTDPRTSEGLYIFTNDQTLLSVGDYIQVTGAVVEFRRSGVDSLTQLAEKPIIERCGAASLPSARVLTLPVETASDFEASEGMLVRFPQPLAVSGNFGLGRFGELVLSPTQRLFHPNNHPELDPLQARDFNVRARVVLDDRMGLQNPSPIPYLSAADASGTRRVGDRVRNLEGVLSFDFNAWRVQPTSAPRFEIRNERPLSPTPVGGSLRVASLNVLNWFTTLGQRGASSSVELERQRAKLVETIIAMDADVLGLIEIENDGGEALRALVEAVNTRLGVPTYALSNAGVPGSDQITVAVIHKPARVEAIGNLQVPADTDFVVDGGLRPPVAQRFVASSNGGGFWFVVNHFKSKGGCPATLTSLDADLGQGCWNSSRVRQAQALTRWVEDLVALSAERDVLLAGDFNAYLREDPLSVLRSAGHLNLLDRLPAKERYSYQFDGESGALDHAFASRTLDTQVTGVSIWHTNADEPVVLDYNVEFKSDDRYAPTPYRASDHDPILVGLELATDPPAAAPKLQANLPRTATAGQPVVIENIAAMPTAGAVGVALSVDWGEGAGPQRLDPSAARAEHAYAAPGRYRITLRLVQDGSLPAELSVPVSVAPAPVIAQPGLLISEYAEGSGFNKAIELFNPGSEPVDLSRYTLRLFSNGAVAATASMTLEGMLLPGGTYVICHPSISAAFLPVCQRTSSAVINFNGDDALTLERDGVVVDQFGQVGYDPGVAWVDGALTSLDRTLRRKVAVTQGSVPPAFPGAWLLAAEWDVLPINTLDGLGSR